MQCLDMIEPVFMSPPSKNRGFRSYRLQWLKERKRAIQLQISVDQKVEGGNDYLCKSHILLKNTSLATDLFLVHTDQIKRYSMFPLLQEKERTGGQRKRHHCDHLHSLGNQTEMQPSVNMSAVLQCCLNPSFDPCFYFFLCLSSKCKPCSIIGILVCVSFYYTVLWSFHDIPSCP